MLDTQMLGCSSFSGIITPKKKVGHIQKGPRDLHRSLWICMYYENISSVMKGMARRLGGTELSSALANLQHLVVGYCRERLMIGDR